MKSLRKKIEDLNLNFVKEISILCSINFVLILGVILLFIFNFSIILPIGIILVTIFFNFSYLNRYNQIIKKQQVKLDNEFIEIFSYLRIYLFNQETVYTALKNIIDFASEEMKERLNQLLNDIDNDKSIQPFINFAKLFNNKIIEEVMISLFEMVNNGNNELYLTQFIKVFEDFKNRNEKEAENNRINGLDTLNMLSILGSGLIMIILSFAVINLLGEATNGF